MLGALDFIPVWASAIAQFEGFNTPGSRPARNNNPGDLKYAGQPGAVGKDSAGFAIFPDPGTGLQALYNQLQKYVSDFPNDSILDITAHYLGQASPGSDAQGNAYQYAAFVASQLGVDPSTTLSQLVAGTQPAGVPVPPELQADNSANLPAGVPQVADSSTTMSSGEIIGALAAAGLLFYIVSLALD